MTDATFNFSAANFSAANTNTTEHPHAPALRRTGACRGTISVRPFARLTVIGAVLAAAALLLGFAAPAQAGEPVLVSNMDKEEDNNEIADFGNNNYAQGFRTGLTGSYVLGSIDLNFSSGTANSHLVEVKLLARDSNDENFPSTDDVICTLDNPDNLGTTGVKTFRAPADPADCGTLATDTNYFVYILYSIHPAGAPRLRKTTFLGQDSTGVAGWTVSNTYYYDALVTTPVGWLKTLNDDVIEIRIRARNQPPATDAEVAVITEDTETIILRASEFGYSNDPATDSDPDDNQLDHIDITALPLSGTLSFNDVAIEADEVPYEVLWADLEDGKLTYEPVLDRSTTVRIDFTFDDGFYGGTASATLNILVEDVQNNTKLRTLTIQVGGVDLLQGFDPNRPTYAITVANDVTSVTVTPTVADIGLTEDEGATVKVNGTDVTLASPSVDIPLSEGETTNIQIGVLSEDKISTGTYTVAVTREGNASERFRRLNEEILSKHALTLADVTIAAVTSRQEAGPRCASQASTGSLGGQSSLAEILTSNAQTFTTGSLNLKQLLGTSAFRLRLTEDGSGAGPGCLTLWGQGDYRNLSSSDAQGLEWDGDLVTGQVGADALLQPDLRAGLAVSWSEGDFDYTDRTDGDPFSGDYTSRMMSVHPYLTWWSPAGLDVWATGGYGQGEIEIKDEEAGTHTSDTTLRLASVGASGLLPIGDALLAGGTTTLRVKAQASVAQMKVEGNGSLLEEQTIEAQRLRLALEGSHERPLASGGSLTPSFEVGLRHDGGDGATGTGLELGGGLRYVNPALGLTVEGRGRVLAAYEENYEEWGASGLIRLDPGIDRQGLAFSLVPSYGQTASGVQRLWDQGLPQGSPQGAPTTQAPTGRLEAEVGYGLVAFAGQGLVTPYSQFSLGGGMQQYRVGSRLELGPGLRLSLEGTRQVTTVGQADQGIRLQVDWRF